MYRYLPLLSWDRLGILVSSLCLVHCVALPVLLACLPFIGLHFVPDESIHLALTYLAVPVGALALLPGLRRHGQSWVLLLGVAGVALMLGGHFFHEAPALEQAVTGGGGALLVLAHLYNLRYSRRCDGLSCHLQAGG